MIIRRDSRPQRYTIIPNAVLEDETLNWQAKGLLCFLLSKPDNWTVNRAYLVDQTEDGETKVRNALKDLETTGYLVRRRVSLPDGTFSWESIIYDEPKREEVAKEQVSTIGSFTTGGVTTGGVSTCGKSPILVSTEVVSTEVVSTEVISTDKTSVQESLLPVEDSSTSASKAKKKTQHEYTEEFEAAWAIYPRSSGKLAAFKVWKTRIKQGSSPDDMIAAAVNYAAAMKREKTEEKFIKMGSTFYGDKEWYRDWITVKTDFKDPRQNVTTDREGENETVDPKELYRRMKQKRDGENG